MMGHGTIDQVPSGAACGSGFQRLLRYAVARAKPTTAIFVDAHVSESIVTATSRSGRALQTNEQGMYASIGARAKVLQGKPARGARLIFFPDVAPVCAVYRFAPRSRSIFFPRADVGTTGVFWALF